MKLSESTINVLKSFSVINTGIELQPGNVLKTISPQKSIMAKAELPDTIPTGGCFYELNRFLGVLTLFCLLYTSPSPRDKRQSRMPSSA